MAPYQIIRLSLVQSQRTLKIKAISTDKKVFSVNYNNEKK